MVTAFSKFGVKIDTIEKRLGRKIDTMTSEDLSEYVGIYNSLKDGNSSISDWFDVKLNADKSAELTEMIMGESK